MIIAGIALVSIGLVLGATTLSVQLAAVLIFDSNAKWTNPAITIAILGLMTSIGLAVTLTGLSLLSLG